MIRFSEGMYLFFNIKPLSTSCRQKTMNRMRLPARQAVMTQIQRIARGFILGSVEK